MYIKRCEVISNVVYLEDNYKYVKENPEWYCNCVNILLGINSSCLEDAVTLTKYALKKIKRKQDVKDVFLIVSYRSQDYKFPFYSEIKIQLK